MRTGLGTGMSAALRAAAALAVALLAAPAPAVTRHVYNVYDLSSQIGAAGNGDEIVIHPGWYDLTLQHGYYINTKAALLALDEVNGDLSDGGKKYREALAALEFETPTGMVSLDERRQAIADIFLTEVIEGPEGGLLNKTIKVVPQVDQTLGVPYEEFLAYGQVGRDNPSCE